MPVCTKLYYTVPKKPLHSELIGFFVIDLVRCCFCLSSGSFLLPTGLPPGASGVAIAATSQQMANAANAAGTETEVVIARLRHASSVAMETTLGNIVGKLRASPVLMYHINSLLDHPGLTRAFLGFMQSRSGDKPEPSGEKPAREKWALGSDLVKLEHLNRQHNFNRAEFLRTRLHCIFLDSIKARAVMVYCFICDSYHQCKP